MVVLPGVLQHGQCLSMSNGKGSRFAITSTMSMAVVLIAPVIIIAIVTMGYSRYSR
jgi:hypothetical protein